MTLNEFFNGKEKPKNKYEEHPFIVWVFITALGLCVIAVCIIKLS